MEVTCDNKSPLDRLQELVEMLLDFAEASEWADSGTDEYRKEWFAIYGELRESQDAHEEGVKDLA